MLARRPALPLIALLGASLLALAPLPTRADQTQSTKAWSQMQECARQANKKFPDHTPDGNAKREAARQECLRAHRLPVTNVPPPAQQ